MIIVWALLVVLIVTAIYVIGYLGSALADPRHLIVNLFGSTTTRPRGVVSSTSGSGSSSLSSPTRLWLSLGPGAASEYA